MRDININDFRRADYEIDEMFLERWSPRSFSEKEIEEPVLMSIFEAARWAPSASNKQPWRFIFARTAEDRAKFHTFIMEGNRKWCEKAPVLTLILSDKEAGRSHAFDSGTAWGFLSLQAMKKGIITHAMGGFSKEKAREVLQIPEEFDIHAVVAIGYQDEKHKLDDQLQDREAPSARRPLKESLMEGTFKA